MANTGLGGSGNEADYYTELDITYDSNGKISNVQSLKADLWVDNNVANISWDSTTGNIYINMLFAIFINPLHEQFTYSRMILHCIQLNLISMI